MKEEFKKEQEELQVMATEKKNDDIWSGKSYSLITLNYLINEQDGISEQGGIFLNHEK